MEEKLLIDPEVLKKDLLRLLSVTPSGVTIEEAVGLLHDRKRYCTYPHEYVKRWVRLILDELEHEQLCIRCEDRYSIIRAIETE